MEPRGSASSRGVVCRSGLCGSGRRSPGAWRLVALVTSSAVERLERSWEDAARLTGVGSLRAWRALFWPLVRPSSARAAALVFVFALVEPGAPLVLGLRRTLAFQIVEAAGRPDPFPVRGGLGLHGGALRARRLDDLALGGRNADSREPGAARRPAREPCDRRAAPRPCGRSRRPCCWRDGRSSAGCRSSGWSIS